MPDVVGADPARLLRLEKAVDTLLTRAGVGWDLEIDHDASSSTSQRAEMRDETDLQNPTNDSSAAPIFVIRDLATEMGVESPSAIRSAHSALDQPDGDLIREDILSIEEASTMFKMFV